MRRDDESVDLGQTTVIGTAPAGPMIQFAGDEVPVGHPLARVVLIRTGLIARQTERRVDSTPTEITHASWSGLFVSIIQCHIPESIF
jgi:hypothetical protein